LVGLRQRKSPKRVVILRSRAWAYQSTGREVVNPKARENVMKENHNILRSPLMSYLYTHPTSLTKIPPSDVKCDKLTSTAGLFPMSGGVIFRSSVNWTCGGECENGLTVVLISKTDVEANVRTAKWLSREYVSIDGAMLENAVLIGSIST
jgi:hypothetical protein